MQTVRPVLNISASVRGAVLCLSVAFCQVASLMGATPEPPPSFQDLYTSLNTYITSFDSRISAQWNGVKHPVGFGAQLSSATANLGSKLLWPTYYRSVLLELDGLNALGAQMVYVSVGFPVLHPGFYQTPADYQRYVDFYTQVAKDVRSRGMKLAVQSTYMLAFGAMIASNPAPYYRTLSWDQYKAGRAETASAVLQVMKPDYLVVVQEPDTEALHTGQTQANTVAGSVELLDHILVNLQQSGIGNTKIGAGVGTYHTQYLQFVNGYLTLPINFIDMHIYNVNKDFLTRCLTVADAAAAAGKTLSISQAWLAKMRDTELLTLPADDMSARDPFSFWSPVDSYFLQTLVKFSHFKRLEFFAAFLPQYFRAYLPYDSSTQSLTPRAINDLQVMETSKSIQAALYTNTGNSYYSAIMAAADSVQPGPPGNVAAISGAPTNMHVTWEPATDNVGVAGYDVYRNGTKVATTTNLFYDDTTLSSAVTYTYTIRSFDFVRNVSVPSAAVSATTMDVLPPTTPTNVVATLAAKNWIKVTWSAAQDETGISAYVVYRGTSPSNLVQVGMRSVLLYQDYPVPPGTTYYYAVQARDSRGNVSPLSSPVSITTPATSASTGLVLNRTPL